MEWKRGAEGVGAFSRPWRLGGKRERGRGPVGCGRGERAARGTRQQSGGWGGGLAGDRDLKMVEAAAVHVAPACKEIGSQ
jgi:hypothetical protein